LLLRTLAALTVKPSLAPALGVPLELIAGEQPSEFTFAVQYVVGGAQGRSQRASHASTPPALMPA
jgi:hypothetical protein